MRVAFLLFVHLLVNVAKLVGPGGSKGLLAETLLVKHQLIVLNRSRRRAPNLTTLDRFLFGLTGFFMTPERIAKNTVVVSTATLFRFHQALVKRKYSRLFSSAHKKRMPGPRGPSQELIDAIVEMKRRNPRFGCPRIAQQINKAFGLEIDKDVVRRVLAKYYKPDPRSSGPSWLTLIGHMKDSLWSVDLFRCESIVLRTHWVMVVMDQHTRRIIGFGVQAGTVDGIALCRMFAEAIAGMGSPKYLSRDNDPLFRFSRWKANLRILEIEEVKTIPDVPVSHPFVERLIGRFRREHIDQVFFWNAADLTRKLSHFKIYFNTQRTHASLKGATPAETAGDKPSDPVSLDHFKWKKRCGGLFQLPVAA